VSLRFTLLNLTYEAFGAVELAWEDRSGSAQKAAVALCGAGVGGAPAAFVGARARGPWHRSGGCEGGGDADGGVAAAAALRAITRAAPDDAQGAARSLLHPLLDFLAAALGARPTRLASKRPFGTLPRRTTREKRRPAVARRPLSAIARPGCACGR